MTTMTYEYTTERAGVTRSPSHQEIEMIEAAGLPWQGAADLPDGTEFAVLDFGGVTFKVYRQAKPVTVDISICPTELPEPNGCGDTPTPSEVLDAMRAFVDRRHPGATIRCLQIGHRPGDGWASIDGDDEAGARLMEDFWAEFN